MRISGRFALLLCAVAETFAQGLSLDSLIRMGIRNNPDLLVMAGENEEAAIDTLAAMIPRNPHLEVDAGYSPASPGRLKGGAKISSEFRPGVRSRQFEVSKAELDAQRQWQKTRELEVQFDIRTAYFSWQILNRKAALQREVQKRWDGLARIAAAKVKEGRLSQVDEGQAHLNQAQARQRESGFRSEMASLEKALAFLSGLAALPDTLAAIPIESITGLPSLDSLTGMAIRENPELKALDQEAEAQKRRGHLEAALGNPDFTLSVGYAREIEGDHVLGGGVELPLPFFNRNQAGKAKARSSLRLAQTRKKTAAMRLTSEVTEIHGRLIDLAERYRHYREAISALSLKQLELSEKGFLQGLLGIFDLSRVQEEFLSQEGDALDILDDYYRQRNRLGKAVGGILW